MRRRLVYMLLAWLIWFRDYSEHDTRDTRVLPNCSRLLHFRRFYDTVSIVLIVRSYGHTVLLIIPAYFTYFWIYRKNIVGNRESCSFSAKARGTLNQEKDGRRIFGIRKKNADSIDMRVAVDNCPNSRNISSMFSIAREVDHPIERIVCR